MSNNEMLSALEDLCRKRSSGMLIAATADNHHVRIGLQKGEIVHLATRRVQGAAAMPLIAASSCRSFNFTPGSALQVQPGLPATEAILNAMRNGEFSESETDFSATPEAAGLAGGTLRIIERELAEYLGPIASVLVGELKNEPSVREILKKLSKELPSSVDKEVFLKNVLSKLNSG